MQDQRQCADCGNTFEPRYGLPADQETVCGPGCPELCDCGDTVQSVIDCNKHGRDAESRKRNDELDAALLAEGISYEEFLKRAAKKLLKASR
jgi:hypothetical protein